jgi:hypothetical protein
MYELCRLLSVQKIFAQVAELLLAVPELEFDFFGGECESCADCCCGCGLGAA